MAWWKSGSQLSPSRNRSPKRSGSWTGLPVGDVQRSSTWLMAQVFLGMQTGFPHSQSCQFSSRRAQPVQACLWPRERRSPRSLKRWQVFMGCIWAGPSRLMSSQQQSAVFWHGPSEWCVQQPPWINNNFDNAIMIVARAYGPCSQRQSAVFWHGPSEWCVQQAPWISNLSDNAIIMILWTVKRQPQEVCKKMCVHPCM